MRKLVFVTGNAGKAREARERLEPLGFAVEQRDLGLVEVQADDLATVAREKARAAAARLKGRFFLEDAGLFIPALRGFPGVYSAYALATIGCDGVLRLLRGARFGRNAAEAEPPLASGTARPSRDAEFRAVIAYRAPGRATRLFHGACAGRIATKARGDLGFGFDPIFEPDGGDGRTFGELTAQEKNALSHRGRALDALVAHLSRENGRTA